MQCMRVSFDANKLNKKLLNLLNFYQYKFKYYNFKI